MRGGEYIAPTPNENSSNNFVEGLTSNNNSLGRSALGQKPMGGLPPTGLHKRAISSILNPRKRPLVPNEENIPVPTFSETSKATFVNNYNQGAQTEPIQETFRTEKEGTVPKVVPS